VGGGRSGEWSERKEQLGHSGEEGGEETKEGRGLLIIKIGEELEMRKRSSWKEAQRQGEKGRNGDARKPLITHANETMSHSMGGESD